MAMSYTELIDNLPRIMRSPSADQKSRMKCVKVAAAAYLAVLENELPAGPNKDFVIRETRNAAMLANLAIMRPRL